jgi:hypothetical protein
LHETSVRLWGSRLLRDDLPVLDYIDWRAIHPGRFPRFLRSQTEPAPDTSGEAFSSLGTSSGDASRTFFTSSHRRYSDIPRHVNRKISRKPSRSARARYKGTAPPFEKSQSAQGVDAPHFLSSRLMNPTKFHANQYASVSHLRWNARKVALELSWLATPSAALGGHIIGYCPGPRRLRR